MLDAKVLQDSGCNKRYILHISGPDDKPCESIEMDLNGIREQFQNLD